MAKNERKTPFSLSRFLCSLFLNFFFYRDIQSCYCVGDVLNTSPTHPGLSNNSRDHDKWGEAQKYKEKRELSLILLFEKKFIDIVVSFYCFLVFSSPFLRAPRGWRAQKGRRKEGYADGMK